MLSWSNGTGVVLRGALCMVLWVSVHGVSAASYFVRTDGNNGNNGTTNTVAGAWKTVQHALSRIRAGDTLSIADGTYNEWDLNLNFTGGSKTARTTIRSINKWGAQLILNVSGNNFGLPIFADGVILEGLDISYARNPPKENKGIEIYGNWVTIRHCHVHSTPFSGISGAYCDNVLIENCVVHDNFTTSGPENGSGISIWNPRDREPNPEGYNIIIRNNIVYHNWATTPVHSAGFPSDGNGIIIDDFRATQTNPALAYSYKTLVENNLVFNNGGAGIAVYLSDNVTVRNNTVCWNGWILNQYNNSAQISNLSGSNNEFYNNIAVSDPAYSSKMAAIQSKIDGPGTTRFNNNIMCGGWTQFDTWSSLTTIDGNGNSANVLTTNIGYPQFINPIKATGFDYRLKPTSHLIGAGLNSRAPKMDLDGNPRPVGATVEPGCYEFIPATRNAHLRFTPAITGDRRSSGASRIVSIDGRAMRSPIDRLGSGYFILYGETKGPQKFLSRVTGPVRFSEHVGGSDSSIGQILGPEIQDYHGVR